MGWKRSPVSFSRAGRSTFCRTLPGAASPSSRACGSRASPRPSTRTSPAGEVRAEGLGLARLPHALELGEAAPGKVRQNVDLPALEKETGLRFQPIVIEQHSSAPDGLTRDWPRPDAGIEKHESYALQWYSLAALAVVLFVALSFRRAGAP